jgi:hypothetical protein
VDDLLKEGFAAVYLAIGSHKGIELGIPGEKAWAFGRGWSSFENSISQVAQRSEKKSPSSAAATWRSMWPVQPPAWGLKRSTSSTGEPVLKCLHGRKKGSQQRRRG